VDPWKRNERKEKEVSDSPGMMKEDPTAMSATAWLAQGAPT